MNSKGVAVLLDVHSATFELSSIIEKLGFTVQKNHSEFILMEKEVNLVIVDVRSNGLNALAAVAKKLKELQYSQFFKFVLIAIVDIDSTEKSLIYSIGASDYLSFPYIAEEINTRLSNAVKPTSENSSNQLSSLNFLPRVNGMRKSNRRVLVDNREFHLAAKAAEFLKKHLEKDINLSQLSRHLGSNRNKLNKAFKTYYGTTPFSWLRAQRLLVASNLLINSQLSVLKISEKVGYPDSNNFSTAFRRAFKLPPNQYRHLNSALNKDLCAFGKGKV